MMSKSAKFLIIDDSSFIRDELISSLKKLAFTGPFIEAEDGEKAIQLMKSLHSAPFDFIICDIYMPNQDGISFLKEIKRNQLLDTPTPILMLTSESERKIVVECMKLGATNYLLKPWDQIHLAKKIVSSWDKVHKLP